MGNKQIIMALCISMLSIATLHAQNEAFASAEQVEAEQTPTQSINQIKRQAQVYIYAEATSSTWEEALRNAQILLETEVVQWAREQGQEIAGFVAKTENSVEEIKTMRGELYRAFLYVKKDDIIMLQGNDNVYISQFSKDDEEQNNDQTLNTIGQAEPTIMLEHETLPQPEVEAEPTETTPAEPPTFILTTLMQDMMLCQTGQDIQQFIKKYTNSGEIIRYDKYSKMPNDLQNCYLFVYNRQSQVVAYLKRFDTTFFNLQTGQEDSLSHYAGGGAIWFETNE